MVNFNLKQYIVNNNHCRSNIGVSDTFSLVVTEMLEHSQFRKDLKACEEYTEVQHFLLLLKIKHYGIIQYNYKCFSRLQICLKVYMTIFAGQSVKIH